jgi:hypothetical protein
MEKDVVIISIDEYNRLKDFEREIKQGKFFVLTESWWTSFTNGNREKYFTESEIVADFDRTNKELKAYIKKLKNDIEELESKIVKLKKMSYWKLLKWYINQK